ncbi:hypothetical protein C8J57DRAFT_1233062 [Mycena rebaudengoi]|nr:hypothetical protein C8J57DRAFT_1233062 [Mycena rebaudengoi]
MTLPKDTSPSHDDTGHDSDSTGSIPDLVAANDSDREADDEHMRPNTPVTPIRTRTTGLNGITSAFQSMVIGPTSPTVPFVMRFADRFDKPVVVDGGGGSNFFHGGSLVQYLCPSPSHGWPDVP